MLGPEGGVDVRKVAEACAGEDGLGAEAVSPIRDRRLIARAAHLGVTETD